MENARELDDWDPMSNDFADGSFNTYIHGPGARLDHRQQPWARSNPSKGPYKLHVANIPRGITEEGLLNIFSNYGEVINVYKHEPTSGHDMTWAFVVYPKHSQAESAIRELNNRRPLMLRVQFARSDSERERIRREQEEAAVLGAVSKSVVDSEDLLVEAPIRRPKGTSIGRGQFRQVYLQEHFPPAVGYRDQIVSDDEGFAPSHRGQFDEVNGVVLKGIHCSLQSGGSSRTVSKGRGFYNVSSDRPGSKRQSLLRLPEQGDNSSDDVGFDDTVRRQSGKYIFGDPVHLRTGACKACQTCGRITSSVCARCGDFYCSAECQLKDWPNHKPNCIPAPGIVDTASSGAPASYMLPSPLPVLMNEDKGSLHIGEVGKSLVDDNDKQVTNINNYIRTPRSAQGAYGNGDSNKSSTSEIRPLFPESRADKQISNGGISANSEISQTMPFMNRSNDRKRGYNKGVPESNCTKERNSPNPEMQQKPPPLFRNSDVPKHNTTLHDRIQSNCAQGEIQATTNHTNDPKQNMGNNRSSASPNRSNAFHNRRSDVGRGNRGKNYGNRKYAGDRGDEKNKMQNRNTCNKNNRSSQYRPSSEFGQDPEKHNDVEKLSPKHVQDKSPSEELIKPLGELQVKPMGEQQSSSLDRQNMDALNQSREKHPMSPKDRKADHHLPKEEIQSDSYIKVKVVLRLDSREYVVQKVDNDVKILEVVQLLQNFVDKEAFTPEVGKLCAASYEGIWYRAIILKVSPEIKVFYVDYGNEETCSVDSLRNLPREALKLPAQAIRVKLASGTSGKYENLSEDDEMMVKSSGRDSSGATVVMLEGESYTNAATPVPKVPGVQHPLKGTPAPVPKQLGVQHPSKVSPTPVSKQSPEQHPLKATSPKKNAVHSDGSVLSLLKNGTEGAMCIRIVENLGQFTGTVVAESSLEKYKKIFEDLCCRNMPFDKGFRPAVGDFVAAQLPTDSLWYRAKVLSHVVNGYRVALYDIGSSQKVENVRRLPEEFYSIEQMSVRCRIVKYFTDKNEIMEKYIKDGQNVNVSFLTTSPLKVTANISIDKPVCTIEMTKWEPIPEDKGLKVVELRNNSFVILSTFCSPRTMFVRPSDKKAQEVYNRVLQDAAGHAFRAPPMNRLPVKGEVVACKYSKDNNYYRAKVIGFEKDKVVVIYLDFGNTEKEDLSNVKELSEDLKNVPASVAKVNLKDVPDLPLNTEIVEFLSGITLKEEELKITFADLKEGVDLFVDGTHINAKLKSMLEPSWQQHGRKDTSDAPLYFYEHLKYVDLPVGEEINLAICHVQPPDTIFGFKEGSEVMHYIMTLMQEKLDEYCNSVNEESFLPRKFEMCLAEYEGAWYRATCLEAVDSKLVSVLFVDYGNTEEVSFKSIRKIPRDFMETPVAAVSCTVKDDNAKVGSNLQELVNTVKKVKVLSMPEKGHFEIKIVY